MNPIMYALALCYFPLISHILSSNIYIYTYPILFFDKYFKKYFIMSQPIFATENCFYFGFILEFFFIHFFMLSVFPPRL